MSNNKQSSIDYLFERFYANEGMITTKQLKQAKAMHKEECINLLNTHNDIYDTSEDHYNKTFNTKEK